MGLMCTKMSNQTLLTMIAALACIFSGLWIEGMAGVGAAILILQLFAYYGDAVEKEGGV